MAARSPVARLTDMIEAIELIRDEMTGVALDAFEPDIRKRWLIERGLEIISEASPIPSCHTTSNSPLNEPHRATLTDIIGAELLRRQPDGNWPEQPEMIAASGDLLLESIDWRTPITAAYRTTHLATG